MSAEQTSPSRKTSPAKPGPAPGTAGPSLEKKPAVGAPAPAPDAITAVDPRLLVREQGFAGYAAEFGRRMRSGELGSVPVIVGLIVIWTTFQSLNSAFLSAQNISNISVDIAGTGLIAVGVVFVLLLGEIDLSVGSVSGLAGASFGVLNITHGVPEWLALILAVLSGTAAGLVHGFFFARIGVPAFVVTMAGLLAWNGLMLQILGANGTINLDDSGLVAQLTTYYFSDVAAAYGLASAVVAGYFLAAFLGARRRDAAGVPSRPLSELVLRTALLAAVCFPVAYLLNQYKGLPLALVIFVTVVAGTDVVLRRTAFGRRVFALGGSIEASRRAGIDVAAVRIAVFAIAGTLAAMGGLMLASKINAANQGAGSGDLLMSSIAAAVIGGTSLFGGRGRTWSALLGVLVIVSIQKGLQLESIAEPVKYMITGGVLLAAVVIDSVSRRTQKAAGRA
ncbi:sugar ABC transporter permease [Streptomyces qinzhouensis]|uniref:Xylose transport system permease protein XylH n=1 Tax=Streptomyces qinzhouensis TaxID=2599401 RepID=A0A5B8JGZ5_9ACTN|nr:sugar ABC transporter permease [Streptomyces qinzhouensis]QDY79564.1 sugar ABC transporter permease [Streptomyces qinzhouensis]